MVKTYQNGKLSNLGFEWLLILGFGDWYGNLVILEYFDDLKFTEIFKKLWARLGQMDK